MALGEWETVCSAEGYSDELGQVKPSLKKMSFLCGLLLGFPHHSGAFQSF